MNENNWFFNRKMLLIVSVLAVVAVWEVMARGEDLWSVVCGGLGTAVSTLWFMISSDSKKKS